jgi:hypothetical protein
MIWLDNLYIKLKPRSAPSQVAFISFAPKNTKARFWATGLFMEGDGMIPQVGSGQESWCMGIDTRIGPLICSGAPSKGIWGTSLCSGQW